MAADSSLAAGGPGQGSRPVELCSDACAQRAKHEYVQLAVQCVPQNSDDVQASGTLRYYDIIVIIIILVGLS